MRSERVMGGGIGFRLAKSKPVRTICLTASAVSAILVQYCAVIFWWRGERWKSVLYVALTLVALASFVLHYLRDTGED